MNAHEPVVTFSKAQISAFIGGIVDYSIMVFFTEVFHLHYTLSIVIGGVIGSIVNFGLNKHWTFHSEKTPYKHSAFNQSLRFILVVINSIIMKDAGTYLITTFLLIDYRISRLIVDLFVSLVFNFTLQKYWVFKKTI
jgi:putative flippase GtrA